jgi:hypothetical protein
MSRDLEEAQERIAKAGQRGDGRSIRDSEDRYAHDAVHVWYMRRVYVWCVDFTCPSLSLFNLLTCFHF